MLWYIFSFNLLLRISECSDLQFPPGFMFGAASSAYQVEGAWNVSDKGKNIWDHMTHKDPTIIADQSNGDVACNSYYLWKEDIQIAHELGLHFYRFSISWTRILPTGFSNKISKDGVNYYNKLIDGLLKKGIKPVITLYHFDLPQSLQNLGGWANPLIADWFSDYARVAFSLFANRVKIWLTINEPLFVCDYVYNGEPLIPMVEEKEIGPYVCNKNVLLAHAKAWRIYDEEFKPEYHGKVSIANNPIWLEAKSYKDEDLAELAREFGIGRYSHAIYTKEGGWPPSIEKLMAEYSKKHGHSRSKLPPFSEEERKLVQGTYDFYGLNHYTTRLVRPAKVNEEPGPWFWQGSKELNIILEEDPKWQYSDFKAIAITPEGIRRQMGWIQKKYNNVSILITENGIGSFDLGDYDSVRIEYIQSYLRQILLAIKEDGVNVMGYTVWSLMDNFEWMFGYTMKFGLYHVNFNDPLRKRKPRASAYYYSSVIKHHSLDVPHHSYYYKKKFKILANNAKNEQYSLFLIILSCFIVKLNVKEF